MAIEAGARCMTSLTPLGPRCRGRCRYRRPHGGGATPRQRSSSAATPGLVALRYRACTSTVYRRGQRQFSEKGRLPALLGAMQGTRHAAAPSPPNQKEERATTWGARPHFGAGGVSEHTNTYSYHTRNSKRLMSPPDTRRRRSSVSLCVLPQRLPTSALRSLIAMWRGVAWRGGLYGV